MNVQKDIAKLKKLELVESKKAAMPIVSDEELRAFYEAWDKKSPVPRRFEIAALIRWIQSREAAWERSFQRTGMR
jgi:hypothetical protein